MYKIYNGVQLKPTFLHCLLWMTVAVWDVRVGKSHALAFNAQKRCECHLIEQVLLPRIWDLSLEKDEEKKAEFKAYTKEQLSKRGCKSHTKPYSNPIFFSSSNSTQHKLLFSSQNITSHNNNPHGHDELPMKQEEPHHHFHNIPPWLISSNPNPNGNNANYFPLASSAANFHHPSPAMSATALLQKAAQMGPKYKDA
ncbi:hypothetical protein DY000_02046093 [Brassica cretica]|uniref:Uncharacterized protein n=1 Tax=Brassica cretica TaxID=69181 RepID=A0ABQ7F7V3_BRACR|nr:hypothetical protein DY000_02046093 [Brassica cretica]